MRILGRAGCFSVDVAPAAGVVDGDVDVAAAAEVLLLVLLLLASVS
jgi:hypothetical protein